MITFQNIVLQRGKKVLLDHASARLERGNRVGLVGRNGAGKSSLMQVMLGQLQEDAGSYHCDIKPERITHLEQSLPAGKFAAIDFVKSGDKEWLQVQEQLVAAEASKNGMQVAHCHERLGEIDGYTIDARAGTILHGLGFKTEDFYKPISTFSGGWQMRLQLAKVLLSRADLLLLDEPTNHLDLEAIAWVERWLLEQNCSVVLISHDREFLDNICTHVLHLAQQKLKVYSGNYSDFMRQFELQYELEAKSREKIEKQRAHMQKFVDRFRAKATKARQAQSRMKAIEKLNIAPGLQKENPFHFSFKASQAITGTILKIEGEIGYPEHTVIEHANLSLMAEARVGLLGVNGAGKSTLIKTLAGNLPLLSGEIMRHQKLHIGYFSQTQLSALDYESTPLAHFVWAFPHIAESEARKFLGGFNFDGDRVFDRVGSFSGGEKARLALALLIYSAPNMLLLDEPTNHLDIQMREALSIALQNYSGAAIIVSHDRHFVNSVVDELWLVSNGHVDYFKGNLDDYQADILAKEVVSTVKPPAVKVSSKKSKSSAINPQRLKKLERDIDRLSKERDDLNHQLANPDLYQPQNNDKRLALQAQFDRVSRALQDAEDEWLSQ